MKYQEKPISIQNEKNCYFVLKYKTVPFSIQVTMTKANGTLWYYGLITRSNVGVQVLS